MMELQLGAAYIDHMQGLFSRNEYVKMGKFSVANASRITIDQRTHVVTLLLFRGLEMIDRRSSNQIRAEAGTIFYQARQIQKSGVVHSKVGKEEIESIFKRLHSKLTDKAPRPSDSLLGKDHCCCVIA